MLSYPSPLNVSRFIKLTFAFVCLASLVLLFNFPARAAAAGDFDSSFGTNGKIGFTELSSFTDVVLQANGKILTLGYNRTGAPGYARYPIFLMRFETNGSVDASFGGGILHPRAGANIVENSSFALQPDGKIVIAGVTRPDLFTGFTFVVLRYLPNGQLDSSFGSGGMVAPAQIGIQSVTEVSIQPDGKILANAYLTTGAAGNSALWRFNPDGTPDAGFGNGGVVAPGSDSELNHIASTLLLQSGGKILSIGGRGTTFIIVRYNPDGTPDTSFGNGGRAQTQIQDGSGAADAAFQPDGKIVLVGSSRNEAGYVSNMAMARFTAEGALDTSFGNGGTIFTNFGVGQYSAAYAVLIQPNGKIIVCGYRNVPQHQSAALVARYNQSGTLDTSFGIGGYALNQFYSSGHAITKNMLLQPDGKLVTVGSGIWDKYSASSTLMRHLLNGSREFDFDGDRKSDVSIFRRNSAAEWYWLGSSNNQSSGIQFGIDSDEIVPADYDGDGKTDIAVFRSGNWYRLNSSDNSFAAAQFGQTGDAPVPSDFDGDSKADLAVYRQGSWYILNSSDNSFRAEQFGVSTDKPIIGDFDGDGKNDLAVYRDGVWYQMRSGQGFYAAQFGISSDKPVAADYDSDGKTDLAVYRASEGVWYLQRSHLGFTAAQFGIATDRAVPADYDNDGKSDMAIYRDGTWYLQQSTVGFRAVQFGTSTDFPIPAAFLP